MRRGALAALGLLAATACGEPPPFAAGDVALGITAGTAEVVTGKPFPLAVVRTWRSDLVPQAWDDRALAPLAVRLEGLARREAGGRVEETRRYRAYAFSRTDVVVPAVTWSARGPGDARVHATTSPPLALRVRPSLDPAAPGPPELPAEEEAARGPWLAVGGGLLLALAAVLVGRARRRAGAPPPAPPAAPEASVPDAASRALAALASRRAGEASTPAARAADVVAAADVVRDYLDEALGLPARERTTPEVLAGLAATRAAPHRAALGSLLLAADRVKFAEGRPDPREREDALDRAEAFVRAAAGEGGTP